MNKVAYMFCKTVWYQVHVSCKYECLAVSLIRDCSTSPSFLFFHVQLNPYRDCQPEDAEINVVTPVTVRLDQLYVAQCCPL